MIEYNPSLKVYVCRCFSLSPRRELWGNVPAKCLLQRLSPTAPLAKPLAREQRFSIQSHPYTLAELIDVAEHHNPSTRTIWERAKQKARELGLAKALIIPS